MRSNSADFLAVSEVFGTKLGICVKTLDKTVIYQNEACIADCGQMQGLPCNRSCMKAYSKDYPGISVAKSDTNVEWVVVNDGDRLITIRCPTAEATTEVIQRLEPFHLSKSELEVCKLRMQRLSNPEIAKRLFVSAATVRTHFNNIYRKVPKRIKAFLIGLTRK